MKLGATMVSERGKAVFKTGNEYVQILINDENGNNIIKLTVEERKEEVHVELIQYQTGEKHMYSHEKTSESLKRDKYCLQCGYVEAQNTYQCIKCGRELHGKII